MDWKRFFKSLLFPHIAIMIILVPVAAAMLVYSMVFVGTESVIAIISYVVSAYTLTIWCFKIPDVIKFFKNFKKENKYAVRWFSDVGLRVKVSLYATLIWNVGYAVFQLGLGYYHKTFWFYSLAGYYITLGVMRFFLALHTSRYKPGEKVKAELVRYGVCGWVFLLTNLTLSVMVFFMVYWNRTFVHHEITTIAIAAYTFTTFTVAVVNIIKYRKYNSPVYTASKSISLAAACVSMLTLESAMLTTFSDGTMTDATRKILLGATGGAISVFIVVMAIYMIVQSNKKLKMLKTEKENGK